LMFLVIGFYIILHHLKIMKTHAHICPRCGRSSSEVEFIDAFCIRCYPLDIRMPAKLEMEQCKRCGSIHLQGEWTSHGGGKIAKYVISKCKGDFESATYDSAKNVVIFTIRRGEGGAITVERPSPLEMKPAMCPTCNRISGGYYEGIVQLRGNPQKVAKKADELVRQLSKKTFISKTEETDGGIDIYVGSSKVVLELMNRLGIRTLITKKLVGRSEGKRLYRTTFLMRL